MDGTVSKYRIAKGTVLGQIATTEYNWDQQRAYLGWTTASGILSHGDRPRRYKTALEAWSPWCSLKVECLLHNSAPSAVGRHRAAIRERPPSVKTYRTCRWKKQSPLMQQKLFLGSKVTGKSTEVGWVQKLKIDNYIQRGPSKLLGWPKGTFWPTQYNPGTEEGNAGPGEMGSHMNHTWEMFSE